MGELEYAINKVGCDALITATNFRTSNYIEMLNTLAPEIAGCAPGKLAAAKMPSLRIVICNGFSVGRTMGLKEGERFCIQVPLYHCGGMVSGTLPCLTHGAVMVFPSESFDPLASLETVEAEACAVIGGVPTMFLAMLNHPAFPRFNLSQLRTGWAGGAPCPIEMMKRCLSGMH